MYFVFVRVCEGGRGVNRTVLIGSGIRALLLLNATRVAPLARSCFLCVTQPPLVEGHKNPFKAPSSHFTASKQKRIDGSGTFRMFLLDGGGGFSHQHQKNAGLRPNGRLAQMIFMLL